MKSKTLIFFTILISQFFHTALKAQLSSEDEQFIVEYMKEQHIPGVSIAMVSDGEIIYSKGFGISGRPSNSPISANTLFQAASISKCLTSALYLRNDQKGKIDIDSSINDYLVSWKLKPYKKTELPSVRQLLSHTGGINIPGFLGYRWNRKRIPDLDMILNGNKYTYFFEPRIRVKYKPNTAYKYAGGGYCLLQKAICETNDEDFNTQMKNEIFDICGMNASFFSSELTKDQEQQICYGHKKNGKLIKENYHVYPQLAAAGLWTTSTDLARFLIQIQKSIQSDRTDIFLSKESIKEMLTLPVLEDGTVSPYGLGFDLHKDSSDVVTGFSHSGANWGYSCYMWASVDGKRAFVIMCNRNVANLQPINRKIQAQLNKENK